MKHERKLAKAYLNASTLQQYHQLVREAKITLIDQAILEAKFIGGKSITQISHEFSYSREKINTVLKNSYDKIYNVMNTVDFA